MNARIPLLVAALTAVPVHDAAAHAGAPPETLDVLLHPGSEAALSLEASFGLLVSDDADTWHWLCHETIVRPGAFLTPAYVRNAAGVMLATIEVLLQGQDAEESMYRSTDGCDWAPTGGTRGDVVTTIAFDPADGSIALAGTGSVTVGTTNGIKRSTDAGATFSPTSLADLPERVFRTVAISPADGGARSTAWATATWFGPLGAWVYRSTDAGLTWTEHAQDIRDDDGDPQILLDIAAVHPTDPLVAWIRVDGQIEDRLMRTDDGGASFVEVFAAEGDFTDVLREPDGTLWVATVQSGLHRADDGATFVEVPDAPLVNGLAHDARGVHLALAAGTQDVVIATTQDGTELQTAMTWDDLVGPLQCPAGSDSVTFCDPNWEVVALALGRGEGDDDDSAGDDDDSAGPDPTGCCPEEASIAGAEGASALALFAVLGLRRRARP